MDRIAKQYNLPREIVDKIDREARRAAFREERIEPFRKVSIYARNIRINPDKYLARPNSQMFLFNEYIIAYMGMNKLTFAMFSKDMRDGNIPSRQSAMYEFGKMVSKELRTDFGRYVDVYL